MYKQKSEIIQTIQFYHSQVARLYYTIYEKIEDNEMKKLLYELYEHENFREKYLEKHRKIAKAMNCYLEFPCEKLLDQISDCFKNIHAESNLTIDELINLELHFDDCLIKIYNILSSENELDGSLANTFYYMLKKTKAEEAILAKLFHNSKKNIHLELTSLNI